MSLSVCLWISLLLTFSVCLFLSIFSFKILSAFSLSMYLSPSLSLTLIICVSFTVYFIFQNSLALILSLILCLFSYSLLTFVFSYNSLCHYLGRKMFVSLLLFFFFISF